VAGNIEHPRTFESAYLAQYGVNRALPDRDRLLAVDRQGGIAFEAVGHMESQPGPKAERRPAVARRPDRTESYDRRSLALWGRVISGRR